MVAQLRDAIRNQMNPCGVVLILAGAHSTGSKWIEEELNLAQHGFKRPKRIIAIAPRGSQKTSLPVKQAADRIDGWNT